jgi:hypothetical protein
VIFSGWMGFGDCSQSHTYIYTYIILVHVEHIPIYSIVQSCVYTASVAFYCSKTIVYISIKIWVDTCQYLGSYLLAPRYICSRTLHEFL